VGAGTVKGATLVEALVALAIGLVVMGGAVSLLVSTSRFSRAGELAGALQEAALAIANIERDAVSALPTADGKPAIRVTANEVRMAIGAFAADGTVTATLVRYTAEPQPSGGFRISRTAKGRGGQFPALLDRYRFELLGGPGGPFLRVTLRVTGHAAPAGGSKPAGPDPAVLATLVRLAAVELPGTKLNAMTFLDPVAAVLGP
jgi:type II secretory pathway pseudopilin PulG